MTLPPPTRVPNCAPFMMAQDIAGAEPMYQEMLRRRLRRCLAGGGDDRLRAAHVLVSCWVLHRLCGDGRPSPVPKTHYDASAPGTMMRGVDLVRSNTPGDWSGLTWPGIPDNGDPAMAWAQMAALMDAFVLCYELRQGAYDPASNVGTEPDGEHFMLLSHVQDHAHYVRSWPLLLTRKDHRLLLLASERPGSGRHRCADLGHLGHYLGGGDGAFHHQHLDPGRSGDPVATLGPVTAEHMPYSALGPGNAFRAAYTVYSYLVEISYQLAVALMGPAVALEYVQLDAAAADDDPFPDPWPATDAADSTLADSTSPFHISYRAYLRFITN